MANSGIMKAFIAIFFLTLTAKTVLAQQDYTILLSHDDASVPNEAEVLPIPGDGTLVAIRYEAGGPANYSITVENISLIAVAGTLTQTLYPDNNTTLTRSHGDGLVVLDSVAHDREVTLNLSRLPLADTMDQLAIASGCNLYLEEEQIIIDRCE